MNKMVFFDTETTGLEAKDNQIIEICMVTVENNKVTETFDSFVKCDHVPAKITELTGITKEDCDKGIELKQAAEEIRKRMQGGVFMLAHNAQFDMAFIYSLLNKYYPKDTYKLFADCKWIDTLTILKDRKSYPHRLANGIEYYKVEGKNSHRAIDDTNAMVGLFYKMVAERNDIKEYINLYGYNPKHGISNEEYKLPFITYRPQPYTEGLQAVEDTLYNKHNKYV